MKRCRNTGRGAGLLVGTALQREVMMHESQEFDALFKQINYLKGGVASGFSHVEEGACGSMLKGPPCSFLLPSQLLPASLL